MKRILKRFKLNKNIRNFNIDIRNFEKLNKTLTKLTGFYFSFFAQSLVGDSYKSLYIILNKYKWYFKFIRDTQIG